MKGTTRFDYFVAEYIFDDIAAERRRQDNLRDMGKFPWTLADVECFAPAEGIAPLGEEFGEVCRAICEKDTANLREELVQLAACCVAWIEGLDRVAAAQPEREREYTARPGVLDAEFVD